MKAERFGRVLGIGLRVAGRMVGAHLAGPQQPGSHQTSAPRRVGSASISTGPAQSPAQQAARTAANIGRGAAQVSTAAARGAGGFLKPFKRVGGILWLEVTGTFFLLFALVFGGYAWQSWKTHTMKSVELSVAVAAVFLYLGLSSFWRARRR
jgi:hypothetical protein